MGLIDKLKNIFTEEVDEDDEIVKVEQIKKEVRSVPIESPTVEKKESVRAENKPEFDELALEKEVAMEKPKEETKAAPVFFTERDFEDLIEPKRRAAKYEKKEPIIEEKRKFEEKPKPYGGDYNNNTIIQKEKVTFKPTPIISPVYGVLDKNYYKEDIVDRKEVNYESADGLSVDSIRNKAYGTLEDEIEDVINAKTVVKEEETEDVDLFDELEKATEETKAKPKKNTKEKSVKEIEEATIDLTRELDNLLLSKGKYSKVKEDNTAKEEAEKLSESDLFNLIDSMYEEGEEE